MYDVITDFPAVLLNYAEFSLKSGRVDLYLLSQMWLKKDKIIIIML